MNAAELESLWNSLEPAATAGGLTGRAAPEIDSDEGILLAIDHGGRRHLLIPAAEGAETPSHPNIRGIEAIIDELRVEDRAPGRYFDVSCREPSMQENFSAVAAEILDAVREDRSHVGQSLEVIFNRWRWFWGVAPDALTPEAAVGLFGELWFLEYWLSPIDGRSLEAWVGPGGDRHDFKWTEASVEVKATRARSDGAARHRISTLDQLEDPESGDLYLFSLRVSPDPIGRNSLNRSVNRIRNALNQRPELLATFDERLGLLGYSPAHSQNYDTPLRVVAEELYRVEGDFPRLRADSFSDGVPAGIDRIAYTLDLAACADWLVATEPGTESQALRATMD
jgi:hypothetical protein